MIGVMHTSVEYVGGPDCGGHAVIPVAPNGLPPVLPSRHRVDGYHPTGELSAQQRHVYRWRPELPTPSATAARMSSAMTRGGTVPDFRVADTAPEHPKLRAAGLTAAGLWSLAGAVAMRDGTDGWVPEYWVRTWPAGARHAARLIEVRLWVREDRYGMPGYRFHDWLSIQRSMAQIEEEKAAARERAQKSREKSAARAGTRAVHGAVVRAENVHDSLSLSLPNPPSGDLGGYVPEVDAEAREDPPAPNLDPGNPRCGRHRDVPAGDPGPNCRACRDVRLDVERLAAVQADPRSAERSAHRAAVNACPRCDDRGMVEIGPERRPARCDHETATVGT